MDLILKMSFDNYAGNSYQNNYQTFNEREK